MYSARLWKKTLFTWIFGRAWYPLLIFKCPPGLPYKALTWGLVINCLVYFLFSQPSILSWSITKKYISLANIRGQNKVGPSQNLVRVQQMLKLKAQIKEDIAGSVPQCTMLLCYSGSTSHNAQCFYDDQDQFSQFSPHCRIHVHLSIILKDTVWIAEFSWFSSLFGIFKALLSLDNLNR